MQRVNVSPVTRVIYEYKNKYVFLGDSVVTGPTSGANAFYEWVREFTFTDHK